MNENRQAQAKRREAEAVPQSIDSMLSDLQQVAATSQHHSHHHHPKQSEEDSDVAPMSALVDTPTKEELKRLEMKKAEKSLKMASSASEDDLSASEKRTKLEKAKKIGANSTQKRVTFEDQVTSSPNKQ